MLNTNRALIGVVIASLVNLFLASSTLQFVVSIVGILVFVGLTAWDTQSIKSTLNRSRSSPCSGRSRST